MANFNDYDQEGVPRSCDAKKDDPIWCFPESIEHITFPLCYWYTLPFVQDLESHTNARALLVFADAAAVRLTSVKQVTYCHGQAGITEERRIQFFTEEGYF